MSPAGILDPRFVDLALLLIFLEAIGLVAYRVLTGRGPASIGTLANLLAGAFLMLVLRETLVGASPLWLIANLTGALIAHGVDLTLRWRNGGASRLAPRITRGAISLKARRRQMEPAARTPDAKALERPRA